MVTTAVSASVINQATNGTAGGDQIPAGNTQGVPANIRDNDTATYYGNTADSATGHYYVTWIAARKIQTLRWVGSEGDQSRKVAAFTALQLTGSDPANPADWTAIPGCSVTGNTALVVRFDLSNSITTKGVKLDYINQYRPLTGEFEAYNQAMIPVSASATAINEQFGSPSGALDGDPFSSWGSASLTNGPGWLVADLGQARDIGGLRLRFRIQLPWYDAPQNWEVQQWDGGQWTVVKSYTNWPSGAALLETDLEPSSMTKVRIYASLPRTTANFPQGSLGIKEVELIPVPPVKGTVILVK